MSSVDANYRFIAASNEVNARIAQRQQTLAIYVTLVLGLVAALFGFRTGVSTTGGTLPIQTLAFGFPIASIGLVLLNIRSELTLRNLRSFLAALEQLDDAHLRLPSYNTERRWSESANRARRLYDFTAAILVLSSNAVALLALARAFPSEMDTRSPVMWIIGLVALICVAALLCMPRLAYRPQAPHPAT